MHKAGCEFYSIGYSWLLLPNPDASNDRMTNVIWIWLRIVECFEKCITDEEIQKTLLSWETIALRVCKPPQQSQYSDGILMYLESTEQTPLSLYRIRRRLEYVLCKQHIPACIVQFHSICNTVLQTSLQCPVSASMGFSKCPVFLIVKHSEGKPTRLLLQEYLAGLHVHS